MSNKNLIILTIVAAVLVAIAIMQSTISDTSRPSEATGPSYLIQGFDPTQIAGIVIGTGSDTIKMDRKANGFVITTKFGYPADTSRINALITDCMDIKINAKPFHSNPENHKALAVTEENAKRIVRFLKDDASTLIAIVIGNENEKGMGTYIRRLDSDDVYLTSSKLNTRSSPLDYIDAELLSIRSEQIESVKVTTPEGDYTIIADDSGNHILQDIPTGSQLKETEYENVFRALASLRFDDVRKADATLNFTNSYVCKLKDSTAYTFTIAIDGEDTFITCKAEYSTALPKKERTTETEEQLKQKAAQYIAHDSAVNFTKKHAGWAYKIPTYLAKNLTQKLTDLIETIPEPEPQPEPTPDPEAPTPESIEKTTPKETVDKEVPAGR